MTLEEIENDIYNYYRTMQTRLIDQVGAYAAQAVRIQEVGYLAQLWQAHDRLVAQARRTMTADEEIYEFGVSA